MTTTTPSRYQFAHFSSMAPILGLALSSFPTPIWVDPTPLSVETFARKFREAREAKRLFRYKHPKVDDRLFDLHAAKLVTTMQAGKVGIGTATTLKAVAEAGKLIEYAPLTYERIEVYHEGLPFFAELISRHLIPRPTNFFVRNLDASQQAHFVAKYDIAFAPDERDSSIVNII